jgi:hypothetical protein
MIDALINTVKLPEYYVPRDYKTMGGMWTVDTWKRGDITVRLMDEGYTTAVDAPGLKVVTGYNGKNYTTYHEGSEETVAKLLASIS